MATIDEGRFLISTKDERRQIEHLRDPICKLIVRPDFPVKPPGTCKSCSQIYCYDCVNFLLFKGARCPVCNNLFEKAQVSQQAYSDVDVYDTLCIFRAEGCPAIFPLKNEFKHLQECIYMKKDNLFAKRLLDKLDVMSFDDVDRTHHVIVDNKDITIIDPEDEYKTVPNMSSKNKLRLVTCKKGHPMIKTFDLTSITKHVEKSFIQNLYKCDGCDETNINAAKVGVYHCDACEFDLCPTCSSKTKDHNLRKLSCSKGHSMIKTFDLVSHTIHKGTTYSTNQYDCEKCSLKQVDAKKYGVYHCDRCMFDLCPKCSTHSVKTTMKRLLCSKGHSMIKTFDLKNLTHHQGGSYKSNLYVCDKCNVQGFDAAEVGVYHCDDCQFDLCPSCSTHSEKKKLKSLSCDKGHVMVKTFDILAVCKNPVDSYKENKYHCNICDAQHIDVKKFGTYHCDTCQFNLCPSCASSSKMGKLKKFYCEKGHVMCKTFDLQNVKGDGVSAYKDNIYHCDKCKKQFLDAKKLGAYHCDTCEYDLCPDCSSHHPKRSLRKIHCNRGHVLIKTFELKSITKHNCTSYDQNFYKCDKCGSTLDVTKSGGYHCDECMYDLCPHCSKGHNLVYTEDLASITKYVGNSYNENKFICDKCVTLQDCSSKGGVFHCDICMFDICIHCHNRHNH